MVLRTSYNLRLPPFSGRTSRVLATLIKSRRLPQALLFAGIDGIGKSVTADLFARAVNCNNSPAPQPDATTIENWGCGKCQTCRTIASGNHPDILTVEPQKDQIRIDTIRSLIAYLGFTPYSARHRFVLIRSAEKMTPAAGNALLKILEEPPSQTHFLLTAAKVPDLLPTVQSRCQIIRFQPWPDNVIVSHLIEQYALDKPTAETTVKLAAGSQIKATDLAQRNWVTNQSWAIEALENIEQSPVRLQLVLAERLAHKKNNLETLLNWHKTVILDKIKTHSATILTSEASNQSRLTAKQLIYRYEIVEDSLLFLSTNVNKRMVLEKMLMSLAVNSAL